MTDSVQRLPDLDSYRRELAAQGAPSPLPTVPAPAPGLLVSLPRAPAGRRGWPWDRETPPSDYAGREWPKLTVVTPSFQQGSYLEETLRSVLLQNYPNLEYVVLDGGSTDDSASLIARYRPWLSFARVAPDRGQAHAINLGMSLARGALRGWLNSDDFYLPGALRRVALAFEAGRADIVYGAGLQLDERTGTRSYSTAGLAHGRYVRFPGLLLSHATFWAASRHQPVWEEQQCAIDYELWIRLLPGARLRHVPWPLAVARQHDAAKTYNTRLAGAWQADAERNGRAHPGLYRPQPWLEREYRFVQRIVQSERIRSAPRIMSAVARECGWDR